MGADSSTLQSIESLNSTLEDIEKKLFVIEDVHLHHERTIAHDDSVLISGKKIGCRSGVRLTCGPVLGVIGSDFARILVEVDYDSVLTLNIFVADAKLIGSRYHFSVSLSATGGVPIATKIKDLLPGTNYTVYIGGITPAETATNYASFQTLPDEARAVRILLAHNGRVDRLMPGESNLWKEVENRVVAPQVSQPAYCAEIGDDEDTENRLYLPPTTSAASGSAYIPPVHLLCHHGNLISIEPIIRSRSVELLDLLIREDSNYEDWVTILEQTEELIREAFRAALTAPSLVKTLRRCGNIFLVGPEEAGAITTALLALNLPDKLTQKYPTESTASASKPSTPVPGGNVTIDNEEEASDMEGANKSSASVKSSSKGSASAKKPAKVKKGKSKKVLKETPVELVVDAARQQIIPMGPDPDQIGDIDLTPVVGSAVRRFFDAEQLSVKSRAIVQENLRRLLAGLLVRSIRRISRSYLRQLWDENNEVLATEDAEKEIFFRSMLRLQKVLQVKTHLRSMLESSRLRLLREFGADNKATEHLAAKSVSVGAEIAVLEMELRQAAERSGEIAVTATAQPNGACLQLGTLGVIIVESSWGWLGRDDQLLLPMVHEVEIHEQIQQQLEQLLVPVPPRIAQHLDDDAGPEHAHKAEIAVRPVSAVSGTGLSTDESAASARPKPPPLPVQAVLCLTTTPLLPHPSSLHTAEMEGLKGLVKPSTVRGSDLHSSPSFSLSTLDVRRVLQVLAKWQQESPDRAVLLSGPAGASVDSALGFAAPFAVTSTGQEITSDAQFDDPRNVMLDIWNRDRSKLQQVLVGDLSRANRATAAHFQDLALLHAQSLSPEALQAEATVTDKGTQFKSFYDRTTQCVRRCFWDVCFSPQLPPIVAPESSTGMRAAPPACFVTDCVTDSRRGNITFSLGPVIGGVTATSANVLVQVCETAPLELICVDQVTGAEFLCSRLATAHRPCLFEFEHLLSNHAYDLVIVATTGEQGGAGGSQSVLWGSFTTLRAPRPPVIHTFSGSSSDTQVVQSLRHATGGGGGSIAGSVAMSEDGSQTGRSGNNASNSVRLLLLGSDKPSWRRKLTRSADASFSFASIDRQSLIRGASLCQEVSNVLSQGWSGVDVVIHCGLSVDWNCCVEGVLNLLTQAESVQGLYTGALSTSNYAVRSNNLPIVFAPAQASTRQNSQYHLRREEHDASHGVTAHSLLLRAFEQLRGAYLKHWGTSPHTSNLLAHGNHYFLNSPVFDLLSLFHAVSLRDLRRDLSPFCVQNLTQFIAQLQLEYQHQLSCPSQSVTLQGNLDGSRPSGDLDRTASVPYLKLFDGGAVAMFELQPNFSFQQDTLNRVSDHLISADQVQALDSLLFPVAPGTHDPHSPASPRTFGKSNLTTLVLLSPVPLVLDSDTFTEFSHLNSQHKGIRFAHQEILQLLDLLSQWVEISPVEREVLIVTGGVATSFVTTIHCDHISRLQMAKGARRAGASPHKTPHSLSPRPDASAHTLHEPSLTSGVSPNPSHTVKIRQMCCGALVGIHEDSRPHSEGVLHSAERRFKFTHRACANGTGAEIVENVNDTRPHTAATSGTAAALAAAEAARAAEYYPQCGVVEILTSESRAHLQPLNVAPPTNILHEQHSLSPSQHEPPAAVPAPAVVKFLDQSGLRSYFSHGWPAHIHGGETATTNKLPGGVRSGASVALSLQGRAAESSNMSHSILQHSRLQASVQLHHLAAELQTHLFLSSAVKGQPEEAFVSEIKRAMDVICKRERTLFEECHRVYLQHDTFPLPVSGNYNVEKCFLSMTHWIIRRMGAATRSACKVPSSFVVRLVWEHYEKEAEKLIKPTQERQGGENVVAEYVSANMAGDVEYFIRLLRNCLELQIVQEYMSYSRGLLDGAER